MKIKCSLAVILAMLMLCAALPVVAYAAEIEQVFQPIEQSTDPLLILAICSTALMVIASIIAGVMTSLYRKRKRHLCADYRCLKNPIAQEAIGGAYDFREFETPKEFFRTGTPSPEPIIIKPNEICFYDEKFIATEEVEVQDAEYSIPEDILEFLTQLTPQSDTVAPGVGVQDKQDIQTDVEQVVYRGRHFKPESAQLEEPLLQAVPTMKHSRASVEQLKSKQLASQALDMDIEAAIESALKEYTRKIS
ncbi:MAG: hypothetical protein FWD43_00240 [Coriobacteriia bacterium]|nr:hypothetical protein [Coriobacteriia bacterium]